MTSAPFKLAVAPDGADIETPPGMRPCPAARPCRTAAARALTERATGYFLVRSPTETAPERKQTREESSDEMLMAAIAGGDRGAFRVLMQRHMPSAIKLAERMLRVPAEADDVAQDAFLRVWNHASSFDGRRARFTTWLYRIVMNLAIDRQRRRPSAPIEEAAEHPSADVGPLEQVIAAEQERAVERGLASLPDKQRAAIVLFHYQGLSGREAAATMEISEKAFESLLIRARKALKAHIMNADAGMTRPR